MFLKRFFLYDVEKVELGKSLVFSFICVKYLHSELMRKDDLRIFSHVSLEKKTEKQLFSSIQSVNILLRFQLGTATNTIQVFNPCIQVKFHLELLVYLG